MALTKTRAALLAITLTLIYFAAFFALPESIIGERREDILLFSTKILFLAMTAAFITSFIVALITRWSFFVGQAVGFNKYKHYLWMLVKRDFVSRYRKSVLGVLWSVLNPLLTMIVLSLVFSFLFNNYRGGEGISPNFPVYLISGQIIFNFFSESTTNSMGSIIAGEGVIKKVYVPKYVFPLSKMFSSLVNLGFSFIAFLIVFIATGVKFTWTMLLIPIPLIYLFVFSLGVAMFMSSMAVFFRDLTYLYGVLLTLWMFLTPIMYPVTILPDWLVPYYGLNPMYHFVDYFRTVALWNQIPSLWDNIVCIAFALASLSIGIYVFMRRQNRYILYL